MVSTLMWASASGWKIRGSDAGPIWHARQRDAGNVRVVRDTPHVLAEFHRHERVSVCGQTMNERPGVSPNEDAT